MFEYVKWCNSVEDLAFGKDFKVLLRVLRYSEKRLSNVADFFGVKSKLFKTIHFLTLSPVIYMSIRIFKFFALSLHPYRWVFRAEVVK